MHVREHTAPDNPFNDDSCRLPYSFSKEYGIFVVIDEMQRLQAYCRPDVTLDAMIEVQRFCARPVNFIDVEAEIFAEQLRVLYEGNASDTFQITSLFSLDDVDLATTAQQLSELEDVLEQDNDAPVIRLINAILIDAVKKRASDIHVETTKQHVQIRFRIDGLLHKVLEVSKRLAPLLVSRIKVMADLNIAEKRTPQDGRMSFRFGNKVVDIRTSVIPSAEGERVVMRLLDKSGGLISLSSIGLEKGERSALEKMMHEPHGIILVVGPTGAGKTTTLYAMLNELETGTQNIMTVEDPIEYHLEHVSQTQVNAGIGMSFASGLRAILRQDPDIVMVGEIRDEETANIAVQASLTGHLVLSTLHTNTASSAITRLRDIGIAPYLLSSSLVGVIAQRLVRSLCNECKEPAYATEQECMFLDTDFHNPPIIYRPVGCGACNHLGYSGRTGIYEVLQVDSTIRRMIHEGHSDSDIATYHHAQHDSLLLTARHKILTGETSIMDVMRVIGAE